MTRLTYKITWNLISGLIMIIVNLYWIWHSMHLWYLYHYTDILFVIMYPDWVLYFNSGLGLIGILIGIGIIKVKIKIKLGILIDIAILILGSLCMLKTL